MRPDHTSCRAESGKVSLRRANQWRIRNVLDLRCAWRHNEPTFPVSATMPTYDVRPFRVAIPDAVLDDLRQRLSRTRLPDEPPLEPWSTGTSVAYLSRLLD